MGDSVVQSAHIVVVLEHIVDQIPHGIIEHATYVILIIANKFYGVVVGFANNVDPSGRFELGEELQVLFETGVKPNAVNAIEFGDI